jgi:tRNA modification GTPase
MDHGDTIAAPATPFGAGAIALTRVSGPDALAVVDKIFRGKRTLRDSASGRVTNGRIEKAGCLIDEVLVTVFRGPRSYTGEDVVEISGHGGVVVARAVLEAVLASGARLAEAGEFTQRAFLNGKMDLTQAEAVMDLINARGEASAQAAAGQLEGRLGQAIEELRGELLTALAHLEAFIDFPEEGIDPESGRVLLQRMAAVSAKVKQLLATADEGRMLREGVRLVIHGKPNVGKSSLLNLLLGYDRAMVSDVPGTTRDTIEENLTLRGIPFRLIDTAGLRDSDDPLEVEGMRRTRDRVAAADVTLRVVEATNFAADQPADSKEILVINKIDLVPEVVIPDGAVGVSCLNRGGLEELVELLVQRANLADLGRFEEAVAINTRHRGCLEKAAAALDAAKISLERSDPPELTSLELRAALASVGDIVGAVDTEDLLGEIFSTFCIGK